MSFDTLIAKTRQAIADDTAKAQVVLAVQGTLVGVTEVDVRTGAHSFRADEPRSIGGGGATTSPVQYALASLGSCQAITYRFWAAHLGVTLDSITVRVAGDLDLRGFFGVDDGVRPGFTAIRVEVTVAGPESEERYAELAAAVDTHCPVLDLFQNPVPTSRALHLADAAANPAQRGLP
jgi:putative redox protein